MQGRLRPMKWSPVPMQPIVTRSDGAVAPLPSTHGGTTSGAADAVVEGVAHEMAQRVADFFEDGPVELGFLALDDQLHFLVQAHGDIADDSWEAVEDGLDGQHAQPGNLVLELAGDASELLGVFVGLAGQRIVAESHGQNLGTLLEPRLVDDQLADEVHQVIKGELMPEIIISNSFSEDFANGIRHIALKPLEP